MREIYTFFSLHGYMFELILACELFVLWGERRNHYWIRLAGCVLAFLSISSLWWQLFLSVDGPLVRSGRTILFFALSIFYTWFCHKLHLIQAVFYTTVACVAQHMSFQLARMGWTTVLWYVGISIDPIVVEMCLYPSLYIFFLAIFSLYFARPLRNQDTNIIKNVPILRLLIGIQLIINLLLNYFLAYAQELGFGGHTVFVVYDVLCCLFQLRLQCEFCRRSQEEHDMAVLEHLLYQQKEQLAVSKDTVELINIKCHDIKNQIASLGNRIPQDEIDELTRAVTIYDTAVKTGNEALDIVLAEKSALCERKGIRLVCMADGAALSFMSQSDIYSVFINALDNAIEAVESLQSEGLRYIQIRVHQDRGMVVVHIENPCLEPVDFLDGLPQTSKLDKRYHGFGVKSIRMIAEKYGGGLSIDIRDGIFTLDILFSRFL